MTLEKTEEFGSLLIGPSCAAEFIRESNRIEGIYRNPTGQEMAEFFRFLKLESVGIDDLVKFVKVYEPKAKLRDQLGMDVRVGNHTPPLGGPRITYALEGLLAFANTDDVTSFHIHRRYETVHPFSDGNGRSGRMLWAWMEVKSGSLLTRGFLHEWYYQSLRDKVYIKDLRKTG